MAYIHCHTKDCGWGQDDFWEEGGYNPVRFIQTDKNFESHLFKEKMYFDEWMFLENPSLDYHEDENGFYCSGKDYVVWEFRRKADNIENMLVISQNEWMDQKDTLVCPKCGQQNWDVD